MAHLYTLKFVYCLKNGDHQVSSILPDFHVAYMGQGIQEWTK